MPLNQFQISIPFLGVMTCWVLFTLAFLLRKRSPSQGEQKRDPKARVGILFEAFGYASVWMLRRPTLSLFPAFGDAGYEILGVVAIALAILSVWLTMSAIRTLGKQWAVAARIVEGHQLITNGPYNLVRNPIYTGMFGLLIATGLVISEWYGLLIGIALFLYGTMIRIKVEEKLLRETFGEKFEDYTKLVPALIPKLF